MRRAIAGSTNLRAPLIAFLDSDDAYLPDKLGFTVRAFAERPEMDVLIDSFVKRYPERERPDIELRNPVLDDNDQILEALFNRRIWKATPANRCETRNCSARRQVRRKSAAAAGFRLHPAAGQAPGGWRRPTSCSGSRATRRDTISGDLRNFVPSTLAFYRRHPEYYYERRRTAPASRMTSAAIFPD